MADDTLRLRVDVETATLGQLKNALKDVNKEMLTAGREAIPGLRTESEQLKGTINTLTGRTFSLKDEIKGARQEARMMRFAVVELMHGFDGLAGSLVAFSGASGDSKKHLDEMTKSVTSGVNSGLGMKFALEMMGGKFAELSTPVAVAVGGLSLFGDIVQKNQERLVAANEGIEKYTEVIRKLNYEMGKMSPEEYAKSLTASKKPVPKPYNADIFDEIWNVIVNPFDLFNEAPITSEIEGQANIQKTTAENLAKDKEAKDVLDKSAKEKADAQRKRIEDAKKIHDELVSGIKDRGTSAELQYELGLITPAQYLSILIDESGQMGPSPMSFNEQLQARQKGWKLQQGIRNNALDEMSKGVKSVPTMGALDLTQDGNVEMAMAQADRYRPLVDSLHAGFQNVNQDINKMIQGFVGSNSVFQHFVSGVLSGLASIGERMAANAIASGILSMIPGVGSFSSLYSGFSGGGGGGGSIAAPNLSALNSVSSSSAPVIHSHVYIDGKPVYTSVRKQWASDKFRGGDVVSTYSFVDIHVPGGALSLDFINGDGSTAQHYVSGDYLITIGKTSDSAEESGFGGIMRTSTVDIEMHDRGNLFHDTILAKDAQNVITQCFCRIFIDAGSGATPVIYGKIQPQTIEYPSLYDDGTTETHNVKFTVFSPQAELSQKSVTDDLLPLLLADTSIQKYAQTDYSGSPIWLTCVKIVDVLKYLIGLIGIPCASIDVSAVPWVFEDTGGVGIETNIYTFEQQYIQLYSVGGTQYSSLFDPTLTIPDGGGTTAGSWATLANCEDLLKSISGDYLAYPQLDYTADGTELILRFKCRGGGMVRSSLGTLLTSTEKTFQGYTALKAYSCSDAVPLYYPNSITNAQFDSMQNTYQYMHHLQFLFPPYIVWVIRGGYFWKVCYHDIVTITEWNRMKMIQYWFATNAFPYNNPVFQGINDTIMPPSMFERSYSGHGIGDANPVNIMDTMTINGKNFTIIEIERDLVENTKTIKAVQY